VPYCSILFHPVDLSFHYTFYVCMQLSLLFTLLLLTITIYCMFRLNWSPASVPVGITLLVLPGNCYCRRGLYPRLVTLLQPCTCFIRGILLLFRRVAVLVMLCAASNAACLVVSQILFRFIR
jgi:hypothetical protein